MTIQSKIIHILLDPTHNGDIVRQTHADNAQTTQQMAVAGMLAWSCLSLSQFVSAARSPIDRLVTLIMGVVGAVALMDMNRIAYNVENLMKSNPIEQAFEG